jgi:hypothetical protein
MTKNQKRDELADDLINEIAQLVCTWYVRRDGKFFSLSNPAVRCSKHDVQRECIARLAGIYRPEQLSERVLGKVFRLAIDQKHADLHRTIPVWDGRVACRPDVAEPIIWEEGSVSINSWKAPSYREQHPGANDLNIVDEFLQWLLPREDERGMLLDWLAWNLQNEDDKPAWAPFFYSASKGTGKSVLCQMIIRLFGEKNSVVQNGVEKLTGRFNSTVLLSKLVVCEEISLRTDSRQGNSLKTFITDRLVVSEKKGHDAERLEQRCCFLFTSNHLPLWIEPQDRRYYLLEIDHEGHASGPNAAEFGEVVGRLMAFLADDGCVSSLYHHLLQRRLSAGFSAKTLNIEKDATPLMRRVFGASEANMAARLGEWLTEEGYNAISEADVSEFVGRELRASANAVRHLMTELRWSRQKVKWGGKDYVRSIWIREGFAVVRGELKGPDHTTEDLGEHLIKQVITYPKPPKAAEAAKLEDY